MSRLRRPGVLVGTVLVLAGTLGFLAASVALARARDVPGIVNQGPGRLELPDDSPTVATRRRTAENVVFGSLLLAGIGVVILVAAWRLPRRHAPHGGDPHRAGLS